ncbi:hypothetical protein Ssed_3237 [Shewanella sediminis HAW-EB3]|uniref:Lipoprotein n=1 Tax=Shewanella sediminis (strain HAW-EB3) TaxID=425104 RepID=A8FYB8_SHESH|nr:hypothetical protein [Shewanella sediminis]ABV37841.1 hypothetical protein Ssed_3237 [Shewanella sediminis HAW-EB3]
MSPIFNIRKATPLILLTLATFTALLSACSNYDPVPVEKCNEVVKHARKVLGSMAPDSRTMMADCKAASDSERGCVMAASKKGAIAQCM